MALLLPKPSSKKKTAPRSGKEESDIQNEQISKSVSHIDKTLVGFTGLLNKKQMKKFQNAQEDYQKKQLLLSQQQSEGGKDKKTTKKWKKVVELLFGGLKGFFKAIGRIVSSLTLGKVTGILGLLLGLFLMLKLGLLDVVIPAALDLLITLVEGLIGFLPKIVKFLWKLISEYVPKIINTIADALSDALGIKSEPLRALVKTLTWIVSLGFILNKVMGLFGGNIFTLLKILFKLSKFLGPKILEGFMPVLKLFGKFIPFALKGLAVGIKALGSALLANPIGLIILAIVAALTALYLIWRNAEKISDWFDGLYEKFTKLGPKGKALVIALGLLLFPLTMITLIVVGLAKLFKSIKEKGFVQTLKDIGTWFTDLFDKIEKKILGLPKPILVVLGALAMPFVGIIAALKGLVKLIKLIKKEGLTKVLKKIWDSVNMFFAKTIMSIIKKFQPIADFFTKIGSKIAGFFEPIVSKMKLLFAKISDIVGSMIDSIMFNILKHPTFAKFFGLGDEAESLEKKGITTVEEYRAVKYATEMASDSDTKKILDEYKNASKERRTEMESSMTSPQIRTAQAYAQAYMQDIAKNVDAFIAKLNAATPAGENARKAFTKTFGTSGNSTFDNK